MNYMGIGEAVEVWGIPRTTLKRWCESGYIKAEKVSGRWLIDKDQKKPEKMRG